MKSPEPFSKTELKKIRLKLGVKDSYPIIVIIANIRFYKGHADLLLSLASIACSLPASWTLIVVGRDDGERASIEKLASELGLHENCIFTGMIEEVGHVLAVADIAVSASHEEGFSNSILESMAFGLPMVVTNVGGNAEAVIHRSSGLVVPPKSPEGLGKALLSLASDKGKQRKYGRRAKNIVQQKFSVEKCVEKYEKIYDEVFSRERY